MQTTLFQEKQTQHLTYDLMISTPLTLSKKDLTKFLIKLLKKIDLNSKLYIESLEKPF